MRTEARPGCSFAIFNFNFKKIWQRRVSAFSLTEHTRRDKSLVGFSIYCRWQICSIGNSICLRLDMLLHSSPKARYVKSERDLSHIELARSDNISSLSGWGSPKRRMSFGGSQRSESISNSSFVNIFHESEYIDR